MRLIASFGLLLIFAFPVLTQIENSQFIEGKVEDSAGLPIAGAEVEIGSPQKTTACTTNHFGLFKCLLETTEELKLTIRADGFSILRQTITNIQEYNGLPTFVLEPDSLREEVVVTAIKAKTSIMETPASIFSIERDGVNSTAASSIDGTLRQSAGFTLFRRSGSRTANPTTQGASLRGVNSSGASRSGVQFDGIPINDPFGGWVAWSRVPKIALERLEVLRGGSSSLYGSGSIGGTVGLIPRRSEKKIDYSVEISAGLARTFDGSAFVGFKSGGWSSELIVSTFQTKGYRIVEQASRGIVDDFANSRNTNFLLTAAREIRKDTRIYGKASVFGEARNNGTPIQKNRSHIRNFAAGIDLGFGDFGEAGNNTRVTARIFGGTQVFDQKFSAVAPDRSSEVLVRFQRVPAQRFGYSAQMFSLFRGNSIVFGVEGTEVRGSSDETGFFGGAATSNLGAGGRERKNSIFFQDFFRLGDRINISGSVRYDRWNNFRALTTLRRLSTNQVTLTVFQDRNEDAASPQSALLFRINNDFAVYASAGRSFRAPTLNELYRGFRVGNVITDPNAFLRAERATSIESGARYSGESLFVQANFFRATVSEAISNVTFNPGPPLILRRRQNAGETRSQGFEIEAELRKGPLNLKAGYLFLDANILRSTSNPQLEGLRIPQVPKHQFTFQAELPLEGRWTVSIQGRGGSGQFDDDLNTLQLGKYFQADLYVSRDIGGHVRMFAAIENLFDSSYSVRLTPTRTISAPFSFRAGVRWN